jgi:hypothetical protein
MTTRAERRAAQQQEEREQFQRLQDELLASDYDGSRTPQ